MNTKAVLFILYLIIFISAQALAGPYYARGTFYAGTGEIWGTDAGNELFDDGLHGDGAPGDGIFGAFVTADQDVGPHEWKIATEDWTENFPNHPLYSMANAILFLLEPGDVIHFQLDTNTVGDGWQPATNAVACSHFLIPLPGYGEFELLGSPPELGEWLWGIPVVMEESLWYQAVTIAAPGVHEYKFRVIGTWEFCNLGIHYNIFRGDNFSFETVDPMSVVRFEFNPLDGRSRAVIEGAIAVDRSSWGRVKSMFR